MPADEGRAVSDGDAATGEGVATSFPEGCATGGGEAKGAAGWADLGAEETTWGLQDLKPNQSAVARANASNA
jgi:hypothetical protein